MRALALSLTLLAATPGATASPSGPYRTENVVIAVMDGTAWRHSFGDPEHRHVPRLWKELLPQGTLYTRFYNNSVTITKAGHSTIATGTWQKTRNRGPRQTMPTLFDYMADEQGLTSEKVWVIFGKGSYAYDPLTSFPAYQGKFSPRIELDIGESSLQHDTAVFERVLGAMKKDKPRIVYANFGATDHMAHSGSWPRHVKAIEHQDRLLTELWLAIESDPNYQGRTTLFLTNDHGYHLDGLREGFAEHGDSCEGCRHVMLLVLGPDTRKGAVVDKPGYLVDIAPSVGELLGFQTPLARGQALKESFVAFAGRNTGAAVTPTARRAIQLEKLASGNVVKHIADRVLEEDAKLSAARSATEGAAMLYWGLLSAFDKTGDRRYLDAVRSWVEPQLDAKGDPATHAGLVLCQLAYREPDPAARERYLRAAARVASELAPRLDAARDGGNPAELALRLILLASVAEARRDRQLWQKAHDSLVGSFRAADLRRADARALGAPGAALPVKSGDDVTRVAGKLVPTQRPPQQDFDNSWMLLALSQVRSHGLPFKGEYFEDVPELHAEALLQSYLAVKDLPGTGELWPRPLEAALNIAAIREFQRRKDLFRETDAVTESDILRLRPESPELLPRLDEIRPQLRKISATNYNVEYGFPAHKDFDYTIDLLRLYLDEARTELETGAFLLALDPERRISFEPEVDAPRD